MRMNITLARWLIRLGAQIQSAALMVMSPDDLIEFNRRKYAKLKNVIGWGRGDIVAAGLYPEEKKLLKRIPFRTGRMLLLGLGGGREAVPFAKMGFEVTGIDFVPAMIKQAKALAARHGVSINGVVQSLDALDLPADTYDIAWLSVAMYSCIPTRERRIRMLRRVRDSLKPGAYFAVQFHWDISRKHSRRGETLRKLITWLTFGNRSYEPGDMLWGNAEFLHAFSSKEELLKEFAASGLQVVWLNIPRDADIRGEALLQKEGYPSHCPAHDRRIKNQAR
ncbi:class I SAM-dependent methyltransferase [bacterium]|nr:class I SAM-dependent methyltransferase [bacterium]